MPPHIHKVLKKMLKIKASELLFAGSEKACKDSFLKHNCKEVREGLPFRVKSGQVIAYYCIL